VNEASFEWDEKKSSANWAKHGVSFFDAQRAFLDLNCVIAENLEQKFKNFLKRATK